MPQYILAAGNMKSARFYRCYRDFQNTPPNTPINTPHWLHSTMGEGKTWQNVIEAIYYILFDKIEFFQFYRASIIA